MHDEKNYRYIARDAVIELTPIENKILAILIKNKGKITTYNELCREIYGYDADKYFYFCLSSAVSRLRWKLNDEIKIKTVRKIGYRIEYKIESRGIENERYD